MYCKVFQILIVRCMRHSSVYFLIIFSGLFFLFGSCAQTDAQREFENRALNPPQNITQMTEGGNRVENGNDPDDWRTSPMYRGLVEIVTPAYPNPVDLNSPLILEIENKGFETLSGIEVYVFRENYRNQILLYSSLDSSIDPGLITIQLSPTQFGDGSQTSGLYRLLIYDGRQNVLSYGDVEVL